jgi:glycosyltransferase involved in cell wall biosynthesis
MSRPSRLSLCMIVRDSSRTLPACLESIGPWVDEMVVVDTGSQDDTRSIAARHGAWVFDFPWRDSFSAARNESLRHARVD